MLKEALQDLRLLRLTESRVGRPRTLALLRELGGEMSFTRYPRDKAFFARLWEECTRLCE